MEILSTQVKNLSLQYNFLTREYIFILSCHFYYNYENICTTSLMKFFYFLKEYVYKFLVRFFYLDQYILSLLHLGEIFAVAQKISIYSKGHFYNFLMRFSLIA